MRKYILDNNYSIDYLNWINFLELKNNSDLESISNDILDRQDPGLACFFAIEKKFNLHLMQKIILNSKIPKYAFLFAKHISHSDIYSLQQLVLNSKNTEYICKFACFIPQANFSLLEDYLLKSKKPKYIFMLLKHKKNINYTKYKKYILEAKKPRYLFSLAKQINDIEELKIIEDLIIDSKSATYIRMFASKIKTANIEKLEQAILNTLAIGSSL